MSKSFNFFVPGDPATAGSKKGFPMKRKNGTIGVVITDASGAKGKNWRMAVQNAARQAIGEGGNCDISLLYNASLMLSIVFHMPRPKAHYGTGKNAGVLKDNAPEFHGQKPDTTKMQRAIEDALTGILWHDDCQVWNIQALKRWCAPGSQGATVSVSSEALFGE